MARSPTSSSDGPSLGHRLVQSSVETLVPGAYYQDLARQQLGAGNYVGAGVYQAAALVDAALDEGENKNIGRLDMQQLRFLFGVN